MTREQIIEEITKGVLLKNKKPKTNKKALGHFQLDIKEISSEKSIEAF